MPSRIVVAISQPEQYYIVMHLFSQNAGWRLGLSCLFSLLSLVVLAPKAAADCGNPRIPVVAVCDLENCKFSFAIEMGLSRGGCWTAPSGFIAGKDDYYQRGISKFELAGHLKKPGMYEIIISSECFFNDLKNSKLSPERIQEYESLCLTDSNVLKVENTSVEGLRDTWELKIKLERLRDPALLLLLVVILQLSLHFMKGRPQILKKTANVQIGFALVWGYMTQVSHYPRPHWILFPLVVFIYGLCGRWVLWRKHRNENHIGK